MVKTISIRDDVYRRLAALKRKEESFSELFERLVENRGSLELLQRLRGSVNFQSGAERKAFVEGSIGKRDERRS